MTCERRSRAAETGRVVARGGAGDATRIARFRDAYAPDKTAGMIAAEMGDRPDYVRSRAYLLGLPLAKERRGGSRHARATDMVQKGSWPAGMWFGGGEPTRS